MAAKGKALWLACASVLELVSARVIVCSLCMMVGTSTVTHGTGVVARERRGPSAKVRFMGVAGIGGEGALEVRLWPSLSILTEHAAAVRSTVVQVPRSLEVCSGVQVPVAGTVHCGSLSDGRLSICLEREGCFVPGAGRRRTARGVAGGNVGAAEVRPIGIGLGRLRSGVGHRRRTLRG